MQIPYHTITSLGRKFFLIDETQGCIIQEDIKERFSAEYAQAPARVGADAVCFLQLMDEQVIREIESVHKDYWGREERREMERLLDEEIDAIIRVFNPMGWEIGFCGDSLRCATAYLARKTGRQSFNLLTGISSHKPEIRKTERTWSRGIYRVQVDFPKEPPDSYLASEAKTNSTKEDAQIYILPLPRVPVSQRLFLRLTSFVVFCNGLHLLAFCGRNQPLSYVEIGLVDSLLKDFFEEAIREEDSESRNAIFNAVGRHLNSSKDPFFPRGVDLSFAKVEELEPSIKIRTYDHAIRREVPSNGNAAVASALVANKLDLMKASEINVFPKGSLETLSFQGKVLSSKQGHLRVFVKDGKAFLEGPAEYINFGALVVGE